MANISSASGTLTLVGYWSDRAVELFQPVLKSWEFHGAYGMSASGAPTPNRPSVGFSGTGRWSFSGTLENFDSWTRDWIKNPEPGTSHPLTQEQYDALLQVMAQNDLSIRVEFNDKEEGFDFDLQEVGVFTSDGESLNYETLSCQDAEHDWTEVSRAYFDGAVLYFQRLAPDADPGWIKKWVKVNIGPSSLFYGGKAYLGDLYGEDTEGTFDEERLQDFCATFSPKGEAWDAAVKECAEEFDWNIDPENHPAEPEIPFWVEHEDELKVELERGTVTYEVRGTFTWSSEFTNIAEHEELRRRYGWRDEFPWDVPTWKDVKQASVGRDYVIRLKTDGTAISVWNEGYFTQFDGFYLIKDSASPVTAVAAGQEKVLVLYADGTVADDHDFIGDELEGWRDITAIAMGGEHYVGLKADGSVEAAGENRAGQCDTANWTDIAAVAAGGNRTFGLRKDGTVVIAGEKGCEAAADWRDVAALDAGGEFAAGLTRDGRVLLTGRLSEDMEEALSWTGITAIAAGDWHILGLRADGTVLAAGLDNKGQCQVADWTGVASIAAGNAVSIGIKADGTAFCAGGRYTPDLSVGLNVKGNVAHNGSNGKLEPGMTLAAMDHAGELHLFSSDELEHPDGTDTSIRGMIFRLSPDGTWRRVANSFDPADHGQLAEQAARLEEQFGGRFKFDEIFAAADEDDDSGEDEPAGYRDFLKGAMELLLDMELRLETTALENSELPHFLDEEGNEYFFGFTVFVINIGLSLGDVHTEAGEAVELTEEQREQIQGFLSNTFQDSEDLDWTEADEAWYQAWKSDNKGNAGYGGGYEDREYELGPVCIPLDSGEAVKVRGSRFVLVGRFSLCGGDKAKIMHMVEFMKGRCTDKVTKATDYVVLGREGGLNWSGWENYVKAREQMEQGGGLRLIREEELTSAMGDDLWETAKETYQEKPESPQEGPQVNWWEAPVDLTTVELSALDFQGRRFVLTGEFQHAPDDARETVLKPLIEAKGGKCTGAVSGKTDYLVLGALGGVGEKKVWTARQLQAKGSSIQVISEETLYQFL